MIISLSKFLIGKSQDVFYLWDFLKKIGVKVNHYIYEGELIFLNTEVSQLYATLEINNTFGNDIKIYTLVYKENIIAITTVDGNCNDISGNMEVSCDVLFNLKEKQLSCIDNMQKENLKPKTSNGNSSHFIKQNIISSNKFEIVEENGQKAIRGSELIPSKSTSHAWLFALNHTILIHKEKLNIGKWMVFSNPNEVDELWKKVKLAVENGQLWKAKVACINPKYDKQVIIVYCPYSDEVEAIAETYRTLVDIEVVNENQIIKYKTDEQTLRGEYGENAYLYTSEDFKNNSSDLFFRYDM